jgi:hypothetical protein
MGAPLRWTPADLRPLRWLATLISLTLVGLGLFAIVTGHYHGESSKYGAVVDLDGAHAVRAGLMEIALGAAPLAFWCRTPRAAAIWAGACALAFVVLLGLALSR